MSQQGTGRPIKRSAPPPPAPSAGNSLKRPVKKSPSHTSSLTNELQKSAGAGQQLGQDHLQMKHLSLERNYESLKGLTKKGMDMPSSHLSVVTAAEL